ncbi:unnamed protein product [Ectocarpus sp. 13 AM-2016]
MRGAFGLAGSLRFGSPLWLLVVPLGVALSTVNLQLGFADDRPPPGAVVNKAVVSSNMRLVFQLGLEGAGHHYIIGAFQGMFKAHPDLVQFDGKLPEFQKFFIPTTMRRSSTAFTVSWQQGRDQMRDLSHFAETLPAPGTVQLVTGGISYPSGSGPQKVQQYMDLRLLAEAAEAGGVDLRVLYLKRSAKELLLADTVHRGFQKLLGDTDSSAEERFMAYVRVLFTEIAVVHSLLGELDRNFVVCHDWVYFGDIKQAQRVAEFIAPNAEVASMVREALLRSAASRHKPNETLPFDAEDELSSRLQRKLDVFEHQYCRNFTT